MKKKIYITKGKNSRVENRRKTDVGKSEEEKRKSKGNTEDGSEMGEGVEEVNEIECKRNGIWGRK